MPVNYVPIDMTSYRRKLELSGRSYLDRDGYLSVFQHRGLGSNHAGPRRYVVDMVVME